MRDPAAFRARTVREAGGREAGGRTRRRNPGQIGPGGWRDEPVAGHADATQTIVPEPGGQDVGPRWGPRCHRESRRRGRGAVGPGGDDPAATTGRPAGPASRLRRRGRPPQRPGRPEAGGRARPGHAEPRPPPAPAPTRPRPARLFRAVGLPPHRRRARPAAPRPVHRDDRARDADRRPRRADGVVADLAGQLVRRGRLRDAGAARGQDLDPAHRLVVLPHARPVPVRARDVRRHRRRLRDPARHPGRRDHRRRRRDRRDPAGVAARLGAVGDARGRGRKPSRECATSASPRARSPSSR